MLNKKWLLQVLWKRLLSNYNKIQILILLEINKNIIRDWLLHNIESDQDISDIIDEFIMMLEENLWVNNQEIVNYMDSLYYKIKQKNLNNEKEE